MKRSVPLDQSTDRPAMKQAVAWFRAKKLKVARHTEHQLKYGLINFYPGRGTISVDRLGTLTRRGLEVLQTLIEKPHATLNQIKISCKELDLLPEEEEGAYRVILGFELDQ